MAKRKRKYDHETVKFAQAFLKKVGEIKTRYKLLANELNRKRMLDGGWTGQEVYHYVYSHGGDTVPRKRMRRGFQDKGIPKECTIPDDCVSEDEAVRFIAIVKAECPPDKPLWSYVADHLNEEAIHTTVGQTSWLPKQTETFYLTRTQDDATNRLREKFLGHQIWTVPEVVSYVNGLKEAGFTNEAVVTWLNREKVIHHRWKLQTAEWNAAQLSSLMSANKKLPRKRGRSAQKPRRPALVFVEQHPEYKILMPDDIIVMSYRFRRKGFREDDAGLWSTEQYALWLNRNHYIRGNYSRGNPEFTASTVVGIFSRRGLQYTQEEPDWVTAKLDQEAQDAAQEKAPQDDETEQPGISAETEQALQAFDKQWSGARQQSTEAAVPSSGGDQQPQQSVDGGLTVSLPEMRKQTDTFTAKANIAMGAGRLKLVLEYEGQPDALLSATLEKLFGMKVSY